MRVQRQKKGSEISESKRVDSSRQIDSKKNEKDEYFQSFSMGFST
jgi:hypothetical protein